LEVPITEEHTYKVIIGRNVFKEVESALPENVKPCLAVVGEGVAKGARWVLKEASAVFPHWEILKDGEAAKDLSVALNIIRKLWELKADRWCALGVIAGGSLGDTASFAASVYMRGIPLIQFPTTLLAMIDSSLGGKTAVNFEGFKNVLGSFYHPWLVVDDLRFLDTLPDRVFKSSMAEAIKYGITLNPEFLKYLKDNSSKILARDDEYVSKVIAESVKTKLEVVRKDPRERKGVREVLNFGHTVGHALESASKFELLHGEAVALGMVVETLYAERVGACSSCYEALEGALSAYSLTQVKAPKMTIEEYKAMILKDKKRVGDRLRLPLLEGVGRWRLELVPLDEFVETTFKIMEEVFWSEDF